MNSSLTAVLCGSGMAAVIAGCFGLFTRWLDHRRQKRAGLERQMAEQGGRIARLEQGQRAVLRDRIRYLGRTYLSEAEISLDDRADLLDMHDAYHALGGNGNLSALMARVMELPLRQGG